VSKSAWSSKTIWGAYLFSKLGHLWSEQVARDGGFKQAWIQLQIRGKSTSETSVMIKHFDLKMLFWRSQSNHLKIMHSIHHKWSLGDIPYCLFIIFALEYAKERIIWIQDLTIAIGHLKLKFKLANFKHFRIRPKIYEPWYLEAFKILGDYHIVVSSFFAFESVTWVHDQWDNRLSWVKHWQNGLKILDFSIPEAFVSPQNKLLDVVWNKDP
jgi:hypothetical protein